MPPRVKSWVDEYGTRRCDATPRSHLRPSFAAIHSRGMLTIVAHPSLRFEIEENTFCPVKVTSRDAPAVAGDDE